MIFKAHIKNETLCLSLFNFYTLDFSFHCIIKNIGVIGSIINNHFCIFLSIFFCYPCCLDLIKIFWILHEKLSMSISISFRNIFSGMFCMFCHIMLCMYFKLIVDDLHFFNQQIPHPIKLNCIL